MIPPRRIRSSIAAQMAFLVGMEEPNPSTLQGLSPLPTDSTFDVNCATFFSFCFAFCFLPLFHLAQLLVCFLGMMSCCGCRSKKKKICQPIDGVSSFMSFGFVLLCWLSYCSRSRTVKFFRQNPERVTFAAEHLHCYYRSSFRQSVPPKCINVQN